jgi:hypothetical protein
MGDQIKKNEMREWHLAGSGERRGAYRNLFGEN